MNLEISQKLHRVEKLQTNQSVGNFGAYKGLTVNVKALKSFRQFGNQHALEAMTDQHLEKPD